MVLSNAFTGTAAYWDRGRLARKRTAGAKFFVYFQNRSRFALIAGETPAVPVKRGLRRSTLDIGHWTSDNDEAFPYNL